MIRHYMLAVLAVILYLYYFFPVSQNYLLKHQLPNTLQDINFNVKDLYNNNIDKMVLVVIDALRYDFITYNNTPNLKMLIETNGCLSRVEVESPTVTLPRIKALMTGSVPQFIDIVINLLDVESSTDSLIHQAVSTGKRIVFYGDNTWLKLYPDKFLRSEGTSSFYVYDYTEVDDNVTRNVREELLRNDWDIMILHYLGLDHIGHIAGPFSPLIQPKLQEMDRIINGIYESTKNRGLILVTGDHGMKDSGGHGGTTYAETRVPLLLLGQSCKRDILSQSDIPLILSAFMGLPFPSSSIGKLSSKLLSSLSIDKLLYALRYNCLLLANKTNICWAKIEEASEMHYNFLKQGSISTGRQSIDLYENCLREMSSDLLKHSISQDTVHLILYILILVFCLIGITFLALNGKDISRFKEILILFTICICSLPKWNQYFIPIFYLIIISFTINYFIKLIKLLLDRTINFKAATLIALTIIHSASMLASSFIEEEHQIWYFFFTTFILISGITNYNIYMIIALFLFRIVRKFNQTGDKWDAEPDISHWLRLDDNYFYYHILGILSLASIGFFSFKLFSRTNLNKLITAHTLILIYIFKMHTVNHILLGQLIWCLVLVNFLLVFEISPNSLINTWILIICLIYRPQNLILIPFCVYVSFILEHKIKSELILTILHFWMGNALYFCQGHSNSLASIDVAVGYVGLEEYELTYVFLQILCHTYSMPILANLLLLRHYNDLKIWKVMGVFRLLLVVITFTVSFIQRHHLFIWSVFAPKIIIEAGHLLILFVQMLLHHGFVLLNDLLNKKLNF